MKYCTLLAALLISTSAMADASYFCTVESSGGIAFNKSTNKWESTRFRPTEKFVLKMTFSRSFNRKGAFDAERVDENFVTLTAAGKSYASPCVNYFFYGHSEDNSVPVVDNFFRCSASSQDYMFNLNTHRFLQTYLAGYVDGTDNNDDTPSVAAGTCTKID
ncbi:hypothetical protein ACVWYH_005957 [Bradyrhizobium sp. GM24.11]